MTRSSWEIESRLREHSRSFKKSQQPTTDLTAVLVRRVHEGFRDATIRPSGKYQLMATGALVLFVLVLGVGVASLRSLSSQSATHPSGVVPWVNRPAPTYEPSIASPRPYPTSAPLCKTAELRVGPGVGNGGAGHSVLQVIFTNVASTPCQLRGRPIVAGTVSSGQSVVLPIGPGATFFGPFMPADIGPGQRGYLNLESVPSCGSGNKTVYRDLSFRMPDGGVLASNIAFTAEPCIRMDDLGLPPQTAPAPSPGPLAVLHTELTVPGSIRAGSTLNYVVTISNPTDHSVTLAPCPGYTEQISGLLTGGELKVTQGSFILNCDTVKSIAPGQQIKFAMQLDIPADTPLGQATVSWSLNELGATHARVTTTIESSG